MKRLRTRAIAVTVLTCVLVLNTVRGAWAVYRGSDPFDNIMPNPFITSPDADKYPIGAYELDYHVDVGVVPDKSWFADAAQWFCAQTWDLLSHAGMLIIDAVTWAFSVNFITGRNGMLPAISQSTLYLHEHVIDQRYIVIAVGMLGVWGGVKALSSPTEVLSTFATSFACTILVISLIYNPNGLFGTMVNMVNDVSAGVMSTLDPSTDSSNGQRAAREHLHEMIIKRNWVVLEFGGLSHCVDTGDLDDDGFPKNVRRYAHTKGEKVCRDHMEQKGAYGGYADRFLAQAPASDAREREYHAMRDGKIPEAKGPNPITDCPRGDCSGAKSKMDEEKEIQAQFNGSYKVDKADAPAVDLMQQGGAGHRLTLTMIILIGMVGILALLARMVGVMLAAGLAALALLAFAPVILLFGIVPAGHGVFKWWMKSLLLATFMKLVLAIMLVVLLVVSMAMSAALTYVDYMVVFLVQAGFYWLIYKKRQTIVQAFGGAAAQGMSRRGLSFAGVYAASRPYRTLSRSFTKHNNKKVGFGGKKDDDKSGGSGNQARGRNEDPGDQETAVGASHHASLGTTGGNGTVSVNTPRVQPSATTADGNTSTSTRNGNGSTNGNGNGKIVAASVANSTPSGSAAQPNGAKPSATPGQATDSTEKQQTASQSTPKPDKQPLDSPETDHNHKWAVVQYPAGSATPQDLHQQSLWRLDRHTHKYDAFGRDIPRPDPPHTPPPPPKET